MRKDVRIRASVKFVSNLNRLYPDSRSIRVKTERLNKLLEEIIYAKKK